MEITERMKSAAAGFGSEPFLVLPGGRVINLEHGYIPLLGNFTFEDKAAKGLRKRKADDKPEPAVYFSALELVRDHKVLLLSGRSGSGKTNFAKHLCFRLATTGLGDARSVLRNELGTTHDEIWNSAGVAPCYFAIDSLQTLQILSQATVPELLESWSKGGRSGDAELLIVLDGVEKGGLEALGALSKIASLVGNTGGIRLLILGESEAIKSWVLPPGVVRHDLLPLLETQRRQAISIHTGIKPSDVVTGLGSAAANPAIFSLALEAGHPGNQAEAVLDAWLSKAAPTATAANLLSAQAYEQFSQKVANEQTDSGLDNGVKNPLLSSSSVARQLLAARHLATLTSETAVQLFTYDPLVSEPIIRSLIVRLKASGRANELAEKLMQGPAANAQRGALLVADLVDEPSLQEQVLRHVLDVVQQGALTGSEREHAGRVLSRLGDSRDLEALAWVPGGKFVFGSDSHPNSQPPEEIALGEFRIGLYPVVNRDYSTFVSETGRDWASPDGLAPERRNAPATDLTWHDAMAYCSWLTDRWRASGVIGPDEQVRLPTEPEWERASRGDQNMAGSDGLVYPWGTEWMDDATNFDETGFNRTCSVGLFPKGRSPYGCYDMAGQAWEWCTTLWGEDMATPSFQYPWRDDGREALVAPAPIRRVLRGGCFSSGRQKACCTYRGSLEPAGFWRGNGFRVVVSAA